MEELRESSCGRSSHSLWRIRRLSQFKLKQRGFHPLRENQNMSGEYDEEANAKTIRKCVSLQDCRHFDFDSDAMEKIIEDTSPIGVLECLDVALDQLDNSTSSKDSSSYFNVLGYRNNRVPWKVLLKKCKPPKSVKRLYRPKLGVPNVPKKLGVPKVLKFGRESKIPRATHAPSLLTTDKVSWKNFSIADLQAATNDFSQENMIGKGGYAEVYEGCMDGQFVAIKKLIQGTSMEQTNDFLSELGILVHLDHPNATKLIGFGIEGGLHLVLQLSEYGNLSSFLHGANEKLDWSSRYKIAIGTALGLEYLHEKCPRRIIHRDIKSANILLTKDFEPQISDFGLAKWLPDKLTHYTLSTFEGTFGYLAPEYLMHGVVNEKIDVFAYGVVLLELITGRKAIDSSKQSLVIWAKPLLEKKKIGALIDPSLGDAYDPKELNRVTHTAYLCIQQSPILRPRITQVLKLLRGEEGKAAEPRKGYQRTLQRTYSEELYDAREYNATRYLKKNDLHQRPKKHACP